MSHKDDVRINVLYILFGWIVLSTFLGISFHQYSDDVSVCYALNSESSLVITGSCADSDKLKPSTFKDPRSTVFHFAPVPINLADTELLQTIKGVGPKLSYTIIQYREATGPFTDVETIKQLPGVGEKRANFLATQITYNE